MNSSSKQKELSEADMINAVIPIPSRINRRYIDSRQQITCTNIAKGQTTQMISGRCILTVPLTFYKIFSSWGSMAFEHTFATDEEIDPTTLMKYIDPLTKKVVSGGGVLVPISVKFTDLSHGYTSTFLFSNSINFLLTQYRFGGNNIRNIDPLQKQIGGTSIGSGEQVYSYSIFQMFMFEDYFRAEFPAWKPSPEFNATCSATTPALPAGITYNLYEMLNMGLATDELYEYMSDLMMYESNDRLSIENTVSPYLYPVTYDPITLACVGTPSYILSSTLAPYLNDRARLNIYKTIGYADYDPMFPDEVIIPSFTSDYWSELIETICTIPQEYFSISVTWDNYIPHAESVFSDGEHRLYSHLAETLRQLFLNKYIFEDACDSVVLSRNWQDEILISPIRNGICSKPMYISLPWYHLSSPSLINHSLFVKS